MGNNQCLPCVKSNDMENPQGRGSQNKKRDSNRNRDRKIEGQMAEDHKKPSINQDMKQPLSMDDKEKERDTVRSTHDKAENEDEDEDEIKGNLLGQMGSSMISNEKNEVSDDDNEEAKFGHDDE